VKVRGSTALAALNGCGGANIIVTNQEMTARSDCDVYDINRLRDTGALAGWIIDGTLTFESVRDRTGNHLWNTQSVRLRGGALAKLIASARQ
jgi:competence protein ComEC